MKKNKAIMFISVQFLLVITTCFYGCKTPESIASKTGMQLWSENCMRCHNNPSPADYGDDEWDVVMDHMRVKANLTDTETDKILAFLKSAN